MILLILGTIIYWRFVPEIPVDYVDIKDHFKYGSIGSEAGKGVPYRIWKVLPEMFPEHLPNGVQPGKGSYASLGFIYEPDPTTGLLRDTPIGFSKRRMMGIEFVGLELRRLPHGNLSRLGPGAAGAGGGPARHARSPT